MTSKPWSPTVFIHLEGQATAVPAGRLALHEEGVRPLASEFVYGNLYLSRSNAAPVDPVTLPLGLARSIKEIQFEAKDTMPLFGAIRDAAPDAWGRRVIENKLKAPPNGLPESVYLVHAGPNRGGALDFRDSPTDVERPGSLPEPQNLQYLLDAADKIQAGLPVPRKLQMWFQAGSAFGGARPKAALLADNKQWVAKFPVLDDGFNVPLIERATMELARECGLRVPETRYVHLPDGRDVMLIERFDRHLLPGGLFGRRHVVSALTMLNLHESESPKAQYSNIAHAIDAYGVKGFVAHDRSELFQRMVFNILVTNDDDHLRNHAFVWDGAHQGWRLSDLYDVVPKPQRGSERFLVLGVGKHGRLATLDNAQSAAASFGILPRDASAVIEKMASIVREWRVFFEKLGVPTTECDKVATAFRNPKDIGLKAIHKLT